VSSWFNWSAWYGEIIQGVFNITPTPTVLQLAGYLAYIVIVLALFLRPLNGDPQKPAPTEPVGDSDSASQPERSTT
jgi:high-affinity iron transporter